MAYHGHFIVVDESDLADALSTVLVGRNEGQAMRVDNAHGGSAFVRYLGIAYFVASTAFLALIWIVQLGLTDSSKHHPHPGMIIVLLICAMIVVLLVLLIDIICSTVLIATRERKRRQYWIYAYSVHGLVAAVLLWRDPSRLLWRLFAP